MSGTTEYRENKTPNINSAMTLVAAIYINIVGPAVFIVQPGFIQLLVTYNGYSAERAGYVASAEMWGIAFTTVLLTFLIGRINWRTILTVAVGFMVVGNLGSLAADSWTEFAAWRFLTGVGCGALISVGFTILGLTRHPDRNFGLAIACILIYGACGLWLMPAAGVIVGLQGVIVLFAVLGASVLPFILYLPTSGKQDNLTSAVTVELPGVYQCMAIATMFCYFLGQGVVWAYLFLIGTAGGGTEQAVANGLTVSQIFGIAGAFLASVMGLRYGRLGPISLGIFGGIIPLAYLFGASGIFAYTVAVCVYNFSWNMLHPYLLAAMASFDRTGRIVTYAVSAQMIGLAVGPAIAATVIDGNDFSYVLWLGIIFFVFSLCLILPPILHQRNSFVIKKAVPA